MDFSVYTRVYLTKLTRDLSRFCPTFGIHRTIFFKCHFRSTLNPFSARARLRLINARNCKISGHLSGRYILKTMRFSSNFQIRMILSRQSWSYFSELEHCRATLTRGYSLRIHLDDETYTYVYTCAKIHARRSILARRLIRQSVRLPDGVISI